MLQKVGNNAYRIELPDTYGVSPIFNIADLSRFHPIELVASKTSPFQPGEDDVNSEPKPSNQAQTSKKQSPLDLEPFGTILGLVLLVLEDLRAQEMLLEKDGRDSITSGPQKMFYFSKSQEEVN